MTTGARLRKVALAALAGWVTGALVTIPFQIVEVARNAAGDLRLLAYSLGIGLILWAIWTFAIACVGLLGAGLPVALWVNPRWLMERRNKVVATSMAAALIAVFWRFHLWEIFKPEPFTETTLIVMYGIFASVFAGVTALLYLRMLQKAGPPSSVSS
jgi:hypothetical protein